MSVKNDARSLVLVVDGNDRNGTLLDTFFRDHGFVPRLVDDLDAAMQQVVGAGQFRFAIIDVDRLTSQSHRCYDRLREIGISRPSRRRTYRKHGGHRVLAKPVPEEQFRQAIADMVDG